MTLAVVHTRANIGIEAPLVTVETHLSNGLPSMSIVGLPETAVKESRDRVRSAIINAGLTFPERRITVNLAPADLPKSGGRYDLAIALSVLAASQQIPGERLADYEVLGELALTGELRPVQGVLPAVLAARECRRWLIVPQANAAEPELVRNVRALSGPDLAAVCRHFHEGKGLSRCRFRRSALSRQRPRPRPDMREIRGQEMAKRALRIAAAGAHNLLLIGPPGTGKTLLANALRSLLPELAEWQALEAASVRSTARQPIDPGSWLLPPFRSPHHGATAVSVVGGGRPVTPGEVSLAHRGVLFLDELSEFGRHVLESLREPLEAGAITISRADCRLRFPARFQLVAAMNPCQCGYYGDPGGQCRCTPGQIARYLDRISGPLLDRIDLSIEVPRPEHQELFTDKPEGTADSATLRAAVAECRQRQMARGGQLNSELAGEALERDCRLDTDARTLMETVMEKQRLSARACHRVLRVARTIADMAGAADVSADHIAEALGYRSLERFFRPPAS